VSSLLNCPKAGSLLNSDGISIPKAMDGWWRRDHSFMASFVYNVDAKHA
jgi:hypothetical protein